MLETAMEALIAAIYLDSDLETLRHCLLKWLSANINELSINHLKKDPKTRLQEYCQTERIPLPNYTVEKIEGPEHQPSFYVSCKTHKHSTLGQGSNKQSAEQAAALQLLTTLEQGV